MESLVGKFVGFSEPEWKSDIELSDCDVDTCRRHFGYRQVQQPSTVVELDGIQNGVYRYRHHSTVQVLNTSNLNTPRQKTNQPYVPEGSQKRILSIDSTPSPITAPKRI